MNVWIENPFDNLPCEGYRKQRFWMMSEAFAAAGHQVVFFTSEFSHANKRKRELQWLPKEFELRLISTPPYQRNIGFKRIRSHHAYAKNFVALAREAGKADIIIASSPTLSGAKAALKLGRTMGAMVVIDVMDAWPETFIRLAPKALRPLARMILAPLYRTARMLYREADMVTGVCERYRQLTQREDYYLAYHGVELTRGKMGDGSEDDGRIHLVYAGNIGRTYDIETIIKAMDRNKDFVLDIAGKWAGVQTERIKAHGYLSEEALHELLCKSDVGIIPMADDSWVGMPYKLCDYAKAGLPIVSSLGGESLALMKRYRAGVSYEAGDVESLAHAIRAAKEIRREDVRRMAEEALDAKRIYADYVTKISEKFMSFTPLHKGRGI